MLRFIFFILFFIYSIYSRGQQPVYSHFKWFKVEDGLPQSFISGIQQDKDGFLWIATRDGLARYDGRQFKIFRQNKNDSSSLRSNVISSIYLDEMDLLWIFYVNDKMDCFDPRRMKVCFRDSFPEVQNLMAKMKIRDFRRDHSGRFWLNGNYQGVICYDPSIKKTTWFNLSNKNLQSNNNLGVIENKQGKIFVFTDKGIDMLSDDGKSSSISFPDSLHFKFIFGAANKVCSLSDGRIVLSEMNRLIFFDPATKSFKYHFLSLPDEKDIIHHVQTGKDGLLYLQAASGVYRLEKNNQFTWLWNSQNSNPFSNQAISFFVDHSNVIWFGTNSAGIYKINMQSLPFRSAAYKTNFPIDALSEMQGLKDRIPDILKRATDSYSFRYGIGPDHTLWFVLKENNVKKDNSAVYFVRPNSISSMSLMDLDSVRGISISPSGKMYIAGISGNIWKWESQATLLPLTLKLKITSSVVDLEADDNWLWLATNKDGLYQIKDNNVARHFEYEKAGTDWPASQLTDLSEDPKDNSILWIGTLGDGLIRLNKQTGVFKIFTTEHGLPNNTVYSIVPDKKGFLWLSTNQGISRFEGNGGSVYNFDVKDGLIGNEFNRFHHLLLPDGRIAFGGPEGYSLFDPDAFRKDSFSTNTEITGILINNKPIDSLYPEKNKLEPLSQISALTLPYNRNFLQFEFAGLQLNEPEKISYRYMLKGYDKEWIYSGNYNKAIYTRLPPGRYSLLINASNTAGQWSPEIRELSIRIKPPFWASWWAYSIYGLIILSLVWTYWKYRTNRIRMQHEIELEQNKATHLKEVDEFKDRFFANITHELRTPLTLILTPLEKLKDNNSYSAADQKVLAGAYKNADHLLRLINQLLDVSKIDSKQMKVHNKLGDLEELVERIVQQFSLEALKHNVQLQFLSEDISGLYFFDEEKWEKIIFNLVSNAIKFTPKGGKVIVKLTSLKQNELDELIQLSVADTGKGISQQAISKLFDRFYRVDETSSSKESGTGIGLSLVKELTSLMNGAIQVTSEPGKGSLFTVRIPLKKAEGSLIQPKTDEQRAFASITNQESPGSKTNETKPLLLLVEDNEELLSFLSESLCDNWRILKAENGKVGWEIILKELPDLVVSDVMMAGMDGYELCRHVKEDARTGHIGFILLTARSAHDSRLAGLQKGADEYLTKPFHLDELELHLNNLMQQQERLRKHLQKELMPETPLRKLPHINDLFVQDLYEKLEERINDPQLSVETLASAVAMSQRTLNRKIKAILNLTPVEFIRRYRLQKAAILLASGQGISDTAYAVGFDTASYFTQCFKEQYGKTPSEFSVAKN